MNTDYLYSTSRIKALEAKLLNNTQLERLLCAKTPEETFGVLHDTFLSGHLQSFKETDLPRVLRKNLSQAKKMLSDIAPEPELLDVLWLRYDFYNLETIIKAKKAGLKEDDILNRCFNTSKFEAKKVMEAFETQTLSLIDEDLGIAEKKARDVQNVYEIDLIMNRAYFEKIEKIAQKQKYLFIKEFVRLLIDLFNMRTRLRTLALEDLTLPNLWISGGNIKHDVIKTEDQILRQFEKYGNPKLWIDAIAEFKNNHTYAILEKTADDFLVDYVKEKSTDDGDIAVLYGYFLARRNNINVIKTIMVAKESGISEIELRRILRKLYI